jgi:CheY-like chemotaxis protein
MPRILIVEDQERVAKALGVLLELHGMRRVVARSPEAALACLDAGGFDAVLQDMNFLPGEPAVKRMGVRALQAASSCQVLVLTAWSRRSGGRLVRSGAADSSSRGTTPAARLDRRSLGAASAPGAGPMRQTGVDRDARGLVYASAAMHGFRARGRVPAADVPVSSPASGTGKETRRICATRCAGDAIRRLDVGLCRKHSSKAALRRRRAPSPVLTRRRQKRFEAADGCCSTRSTASQPPANGSCACCRPASCSAWALGSVKWTCAS